MARKKGRFEGKKIEVGGIQYLVKYRKRTVSKKSKNIAIRGEISFNDRIIYIEKGLPPSEEVLTIIHEILHGILDALAPPGLESEIDPSLEELFVEALSRAIATSFRSISLIHE